MDPVLLSSLQIPELLKKLEAFGDRSLQVCFLLLSFLFFYFFSENLGLTSKMERLLVILRE